MKSQRGGRTAYFDLLNIVSCIAVLVLHMNSASWNFEDTWLWRQALGAEVVCYFAVPVFFMLTGATLMGYRERCTTLQFLRKRSIKILIPYFVWSTFYYLLSIVTGTGEVGIRQLIEAFTAYKAQPVFWFMQAVFNIYLCLPFLSLLADKKYEMLRWYLIGLGIVTRMLLPMCSQYLGISFGSYSGLFCMDGVLLYALLGYQLAQCTISKSAKTVVVLAAIAALAVRYFGTILLSVRQGTLVTDFYGYTTVWALLPAMAVFLMAKDIPMNNISDATRRVLALLSSFSFGVYLMHLFVIAVFSKVFQISNASLLYRLGGPAIIYVICCVSVFVLKKIPVLRTIVP